jgi:hypothetical protein
MLPDPMIPILMWLFPLSALRQFELPIVSSSGVASGIELV